MALAILKSLSKTSLKVTGGLVSPKCSPRLAVVTFVSKASVYLLYWEKTTDKLAAVVVFPAPPLGETIAITLFIMSPHFFLCLFHYLYQLFFFIFNFLRNCLGF